MQVDEPVRVLFVAFFQAFQGAVIFSQAEVDSSEEVRCNILLLCQSDQSISRASVVLPAVPEEHASAARIKGLPFESFTALSPSAMASS